MLCRPATALHPMLLNDRVNSSSTTWFVLTCVGVTSLALLFSGTACWYGTSQLHWQSCGDYNIYMEFTSPMIIIGIATLLPVTYALVATYRDYKKNQRNVSSVMTYYMESEPLLETNPHKFDPSFNYCYHRFFAYLYASHFISAWGDRMWQFAIPILFMEVFVDTLLPSALYSLIQYSACVIFVPRIGKLIDSSNRLSVMSWSIVIENAMIVVSTILIATIMLVTSADGVTLPVWNLELIILFSLVILTGAIGQVLSQAQTLCLERDWVVVFAEQLPAKKDLEKNMMLTSFNTTLRRIDLLCKVLGPTAFGLVMEFAGSDPTARATIGASVVGIWNVLAFPLELCMIRDLYYFCPALKKIRKKSDEDLGKNEGGFVSQWKAYYRHPVFVMSFSFCLLYMTVLDGGTLNTGYLKWRGVSDGILGGARGVGAIFGLVGTFCFPHLVKLVGGSIERVSVLGVWLFWLSLFPIIIAFCVAGSKSVVSDYTMIAAMVLSRAFLWITDLAETQVMQSRVAEHERGSINAMQSATSKITYIVILVFGIVFSNPVEFTALVVYSVLAVLASAIGFSYWYSKVVIDS